MSDVWGWIGYDELVAVGNADDGEWMDCMDEINWQDGILALLFEYWETQG